jgi:hypothetical protein
MITLTLKRDSNGNKVLQAKPGTGRAFSVQTLGNLPTAHTLLITSHKSNVLRSACRGVQIQGSVVAVRSPEDYNRIALAILAELKAHITQHGTARQKAVLCVE